MTPAPQEYIITERQIQELSDKRNLDFSDDILYLIGRVHSRPYTSASIERRLKEYQELRDEFKVGKWVLADSASSDVLEELEQWHYDEINRFKLKRPSTINYIPSIKAHEQSIKRIAELRQQTKEREG